MTKSAEETEQVAKKIIENELFLDTEEASSKSKCILLKGNLGTGKTTFTKGIAKALGIPDKIKSPTYTYSNHYEFIKNDEKWSLIHFDLYRLDEDIPNPEQVSAEIGLEDALNKARTLVVIEWPERLGLEEADILLELSTEKEGHLIEVHKEHLTKHQ